MPICSTASSLLRRPAVSTTWMGMPLIWMVCCTLSRVVPATGVTMASSAPANALSKEDLPAFGWPAMTTVMPSRSKAPWVACCSTCCTVPCSVCSCPNASAFCRKSISSSGKSSVASTSMRRWISASSSVCTCRENAPANDCVALRAAASVLASIKSAMASAWVRSILPFRKARWENSPGSAMRSPGKVALPDPLETVAASSRQRATSNCKTTAPPWACSSSTSSPVKEWGAGKYKASPWSSGWPCASAKGR